MCTSDSKYVFLSKEDSVLMQWNLLENKKEHIYKFRGIVSQIQFDINNLYMFAVTWAGEFKIFSLETK